VEELQLVKPEATDYEPLTGLWEASVRATHDFLPESGIHFFKPLVRDQFLASVDLYALQDGSGRFHGFLGVLDGMGKPYPILHMKYRPNN
jgi:putative acetyltransferase